MKAYKRLVLLGENPGQREAGVTTYLQAVFPGLEIREMSPEELLSTYITLDISNTVVVILGAGFIFHDSNPVLVAMEKYGIKFTATVSGHQIAMMLRLEYPSHQVPIMVFTDFPEEYIRQLVPQLPSGCTEYYLDDNLEKICETIEQACSMG